MSGKTEASVNISTDFNMDDILGVEPSSTSPTVTTAPKLEAQTSKPGDAPSKESAYDKSVRLAKEKEQKAAEKAAKKAAKTVSAPAEAPVPIAPGQLELFKAEPTNNTVNGQVTDAVTKHQCESAFTKDDAKYLKDALVTIGAKISDINGSLKEIAATNAESLRLYKNSCEFQAKAILELISKIAESIDSNNSKTIAIPAATTVSTTAPVSTPAPVAAKPAQEVRQTPKEPVESTATAETVTVDMLKQLATEIVGEGKVDKKKALMNLLEANNAKPIAMAKPEQYVELFNGMMRIKNS